MKEIDDTPLNKSESEDLETICALLYPQVSAFIEVEMHRIMERLKELEKRVAKLETRKVIDAQRNEDEEWF